LKRRDGVSGICLAMLFTTFWCAGAAGSPAEDLQQAVDLYQAQRYVQAYDLLQRIEPNSLTQEQRQVRSEYLAKAKKASRLQIKAGQDLKDAQKALAAGKLDIAEPLLKGVLSNEYAAASQKAQAQKALALVAEKRKLAEQVALASAAEPPPATQPAYTEVPATQPAATRPTTEEQALLLVKQAQAATEAGEYDVAEIRLKKALELVPNLPEAEDAMKRLAQMRVALPASTLVDRIRQANRLRWDMAVKKYRDLERQILRDVNNHRFAEARQKLLEARQVIAVARPYAESSEMYRSLLADIESLGKFIGQEERIFHEQKVRQQVLEAAKREAERRRLAEQTKQRQIKELMAEARRLYRERRFEEAVQTIKQVRAIDPSNELARWLERDWGELAIHKREKRMIEEMRTERQLTLLDADESMIPWHVFVRYPENWAEINRRQERYGAFQRMEDEATRKARKILKQTVDEVAFQPGGTFQDAIELLRTLSGLNIVVNWNALGQVGVTGDLEISLPPLKNVKLQKALQLLLDQVSATLAGVAELDWVVDEGIVTISTKDDLSQKLILRVYDIGDLLVPRQVVGRGTGFSLIGGGLGGGGIGGVGGGIGGVGGGVGGIGGGIGGVGGGVTGGTTGTTGGTTGTTGGTTGTTGTQLTITDLVDEIQTLIQETVEPDSWTDVGGQASVRVWNDRVLIITQTPKGHEEIRSLLKQLRDILAVQVAVEARFLTVSRNFLREIGVDLDVILNQGTAGFDRVFSGGAPVTDPFTRAPVLMPRTFTRTGIVPGTPTVAPWASGTAMAQLTPDQPYGFVGGVPLPGTLSPHSGQFTPIPLVNNTLRLVDPSGVTTNVPGSFAGEGFAPAFQILGSFLDNIQVDFLLRATEADRRSTVLTAPRVVLRNTQEARVEVQTLQAYVANVEPVVAEGVASGASQIGVIGTGSSLWVQAAVSSDLKYVTLTLEPYTQQLVDLATFTPVVGAAAPGVGGVAGAATPTFQIQLPITEISAVITQVSVPDGGTLLLGGQKLAGQVEIEAGVPLLSRIPILKRAFTNRTTIKDEQTLLILVTPRILVQPEEEEKAFPELAQPT